MGCLAVISLSEGEEYLKIVFTPVAGHHNCRLMVTHGGLHTWMEAVYHGVPLLGILPMFLDQFHNLAEIEHRQHGIYFAGPWNEHSFQDAVHKVLFNSKLVTYLPS